MKARADCCVLPQRARTCPHNSAKQAGSARAVLCSASFSDASAPARIRASASTALSAPPSHRSRLEDIEVAGYGSIVKRSCTVLRVARCYSGHTHTHTLQHLIQILVFSIQRGTRIQQCHDASPFKGSAKVRAEALASLRNSTWGRAGGLLLRHASRPSDPGNSAHRCRSLRYAGRTTINTRNASRMIPNDPGGRLFRNAAFYGAA